MARMNLREMIFMLHLFGRFGRVRRCGVPLVLGHEHPGHHHTQTDPTCPYAQSSGPAPLPLFPAPRPVSLASVWVPPCPVAQTHAHFGATILSSLEMALMQRRPENVIHHSDRGCQHELRVRQGLHKLLCEQARLRRECREITRTKMKLPKRPGVSQRHNCQAEVPQIFGGSLR